MSSIWKFISLSVFVLAIFVTPTLAKENSWKETNWKPQDLPATGHVLSVKVVGQRAVIVCQPKNNAPLRLYLLDVSTPSEPKVLGSYDTPDKYFLGASTIKADFDENHLYMVPARSYSTDLYVFDISDPKKISHVKTLPLNRPKFYYVEFPQHVVLSGGKLFVTIQNANYQDMHGNFFVFDVSTPATAKSPKLVDQNNGYFIAARGKKLFTSDSDSMWVRQRDTSKLPIFAKRIGLDKVSPRFVTTIQRQGIRGMAQHGDRAVVKVFYQTGRGKNKKTVTELGWMNLKGKSKWRYKTIESMEKNDRLVGANFNGQVLTIEYYQKIKVKVRDGKKWKELGTINMAKSNYGRKSSQLAGNYLYIPARKKGLKIIGPFSSSK